jgi:ADP-ribose pyrophosphatase YjhB (NUDIX family)
MARLPLGVRRQGYRVAYQLLRGYSLLRHPSLTGVKCALTDGERVLLVRHTYGRPGWGLPGGILRHGEDPARTTRRELREELGLEVGELRGLGEIEVAIDGRHDRVHCFAAAVSRPAMRPDGAEIADARWWPRDRLPEQLSPYTREIVERL